MPSDRIGACRKESCVQMGLPFEAPEKSLADFFAMALETPVAVVLTANTSRMFSYRRRGGLGNGGYELRIHRMFAHAPGPVLLELAGFIKRSGGPTPGVDRYIQTNRDVIARGDTPHRASVTLRPAGNHHDLDRLMREVNREYFGGRIECGITWGRRSGRRRVRRRTLASYSERTRTIRVNPILDSANVPEYYLRYIVYHEMLHAELGTPLKNGRREIHSSAFKLREREYGEFERALAWERKNL